MSTERGEDHKAALEDAASDDDAASHRAQPGSLYVVATPLGNLRDVTLRALDMLRTVDVVAAEDTRVSARLLRRYGVTTSPIALHAHNEQSRSELIVKLLAEGRSVALITDAGTPAVSDPGARVVAAAHAAGNRVVPIPGPSAGVAALSAAGLRAGAFVFLGFLPLQRKARATSLAQVAGLPLALVIYEAPHRVRATVADLRAALYGERALVVARELTKTFESIATMTLDSADDWFAADSNRERGEFVLLVDAPLDAGRPTELTAEAERWIRGLAGELPPARVARIVAELTGAPRDSCYALAIALKPGAP